MAKHHGKDGYFMLNAVDLTTFLTDISFEESVDTAETSTMGDEAKEYIGGLSGGSISLSGMWDETASTGPDAVLAALVGADATAFIYGPAGGASGQVKYSGSAILTAYARTTPIGGAVAFTAGLQVTGAVTRGTFAP